MFPQQGDVSGGLTGTATLPKVTRQLTVILENDSTTEGNFGNNDTGCRGKSGSVTVADTLKGASYRHSFRHNHRR